MKAMEYMVRFLRGRSRRIETEIQNKTYVFQQAISISRK
jgi:hypothetical protein